MKSCLLSKLCFCAIRELFSPRLLSESAGQCVREKEHKDEGAVLVVLPSADWRLETLKVYGVGGTAGWKRVYAPLRCVGITDFENL